MLFSFRKQHKYYEIYVERTKNSLCLDPYISVFITPDDLLCCRRILIFIKQIRNLILVSVCFLFFYLFISQAKHDQLHLHASFMVVLFGVKPKLSFSVVITRINSN